VIEKAPMPSTHLEANIVEFLMIKGVRQWHYRCTVKDIHLKSPGRHQRVCIQHIELSRRLFREGSRGKEVDCGLEVEMQILLEQQSVMISARLQLPQEILSPDYARPS
jgi:hypothetical protein